MRQAIQVIGILGSYLFLLGVKSVQAKFQTGCAKVKVLSSTSSCQELKVAFDLTSCGFKLDESRASDIKISCSGDLARATLTSENFEYIAQLKKQEGWGEGNWETIGRVKRHFIKKAEKSIKSEVALEKPPLRKESSDSDTSNLLTGPTPASLTPVTGPSGLTFSGLFDLYYSYNYNRPLPIDPPNSSSVASSGLSYGNNNLRYYDQYHDQFAMNLVELEIKKTGSEIGFLIDLDFGEAADLNVATGAGTRSQFIDEVSKNIGQAYITYSPSWAPRWSLNAGKMVTHMDLELVKAKDNYNYSRSILFSYGGPFWHTGANINYVAVPDRLQAGFFIYNGWNTIYDSNASKTIGTQLKFTPTDAVIMYNMIAGPEQPKNSSNWRVLNEVNVTWNATSNLAIQLDAHYGTEAKVMVGTEVVNASWWAATFASKFQFFPRYYLSPRFEVYRDNHGYTLSGKAQTIHSFTLTNSLSLADGFEARLEFKYDYSTSNERFITKNSTSKSQLTTVLALLYSF